MLACLSQRALILMVTAGCAARTTPPLMRTVDALVQFDGRQAGTPNERAAADYIIDRMRRAGLTPVEQPFGGGTNVYAIVRGASDDAIVLGAHFDHLGHGYPGADDNASGVAVVLAVAEALATRHLERTIVIACFSAEEDGLAGSEYFVEHLPVQHVTAMVNLDMVGRPLQDRFWFRRGLGLFGVPRDAIGLVGTRRYPALRALADAAFDDATLAAEDLPDRIEREVEAQSNNRSDSASFEARGIPSLFFGDGESTDYHQPTDTPDKLHPALLARRARAIARVVTALAHAPPSTFAATDATPAKRYPGGWYLPIGFSNGLRVHPDVAYVLGGEASLVHLAPTTHLFAGIYADALHDDRWRMSAGPELGWRWIGIDGGYATDGTHHGFVVRPFASIALLTLGARAGKLDGWFGELDLLVKLPIAL